MAAFFMGSGFKLAEGTIWFEGAGDMQEGTGSGTPVYCDDVE